MSKEIEVVYKDILRASKVFDANGKKYDAIVPKGVPQIPTVTEDSLHDALSTVLHAVSVLHDALGASMQAYGNKLKIVHDRYQKVEKDVGDLLRSIDDPTKIQPDLGY